MWHYARAFRRSPLLPILAGALLVRLLLVVLTPPLFAPDEGPHLLYVHAVATGPRFPLDSFEEHRLLNTWADEFYQPPLFYLLAAPIYRLLQPFGLAPVFGARLVNVALGLGVVVVIYLTARRIFPNRPWVAGLAATLTAFLPTFAGNSASVNNDVLCVLLVALATYSMVTALLEGKLRRRQLVALSVLVALALYTKSSAIVLVPTVVLWGWLLRRQGLPGLRSGLVVLALVMGAVAPWWLLRNLAHYGNLLGVLAWTPLAAQPTDRVADTVSLMGWSFWVAFGRIYEVRPAWPFVILPWLLVVVALWRVANVWARPGLTLGQRQGLILLSFITLCTTVAVLKFAGLDYGQAQGRYLYPALPAIAIIVSLGLADLLERWRRWAPRGLAVGMAAYCAAVLGLVVLPGFRHVEIVTEVCGPALPFQAGDYYSWVSDRRIPSHGAGSPEGSAAVCGTRTGSFPWGSELDWSSGAYLVAVQSGLWKLSTAT